MNRNTMLYQVSLSLLFLMFIIACNSNSVPAVFNQESFFKEMSLLEKNRADFIIEKKEILKVTMPDKKGAIEPMFANMGLLYDDNYQRLFVTDMIKHRILVYDSDLNFLKSFGSFGQGPGEFNQPTSVAVFNNGDILVLDYRNKRFQIFDPEYKFVKSINNINHFGGADCGVRIDSKNRIFTKTPSMNKNDPLFTVYDRDGAIIATFGEAFNKYENMMDVDNIIMFELDADDNLYCAFRNYPVIRKYDKNFQLLFEKNYEELPVYNAIYTMWNERQKEKPMDGVHSYSHKSFVEYIDVDSEALYVCFGLSIPEFDKLFVFDKETGEALNRKIDITHEKYKPLFLTVEFSADDYIYALNRINLAVLKYSKR